MNILMITGGKLPLPAIKGGAVETLNQILLDNNEIIKNNHFTVWSSYEDGIEEIASKYKYSTFYYVDNNKISVDKIIRYLINSKTSHYIGNYYISQVIKREKEEMSQYDSVLIENEPLFVLKIREIYSGKIALHLHNDYLNKFSKYAKQIYEECDYIWGVSDYITNRVNAISPGGKAKTWYNGIDTKYFFDSRKQRDTAREKYNIKPDEICIIYSGRIVQEKGLKELLQAYAQLSVNNNVRLLVAGGEFYGTSDLNSYQKKCMEIADKSKNPVDFLGCLPYKDMPSFYAAADIGVMPSLWEEPCSLSLLEMMASGLPTIVTDCHSFNEVTNDSCSVCVHRGENLINEISLNLQNLISKPELRYTMGQAAIKRSKTFDKDAYIARFDELMDIEDGFTGHEEI